jgi:predicted enzyme related to lactoylglutathione lyase
VSHPTNHNRIDYIEIPVTSCAKAKAFYGSVFGWTFVDYGPSYVAFNDGRLDGGFREEATVRPGFGPLVVIFSDAIEGTRAAVREAGGRITKDIFDFPGGRRFHFSDPSGNELAVWASPW